MYSLQDLEQNKTEGIIQSFIDLNIPNLFVPVICNTTNDTPIIDPPNNTSPINIIPNITNIMSKLTVSDSIE